MTVQSLPLLHGEFYLTKDVTQMIEEWCLKWTSLDRAIKTGANAKSQNTLDLDQTMSTKYPLQIKSSTYLE